MTLKNSTYKKTPEYSPNISLVSLFLKKRTQSQKRLENVNYFAITRNLQAALPVHKNNWMCPNITHSGLQTARQPQMIKMHVQHLSFLSKAESRYDGLSQGKRQSGRITEKACHKKHRTAFISSPSKEREAVVEGKQRQWPSTFSHKPQNKCAKWVSLAAKKIHLWLASIHGREQKHTVSPEESCRYLLKVLRVGWQTTRWDITKTNLISPKSKFKRTPRMMDLWHLSSKKD